MYYYEKKFVYLMTFILILFVRDSNAHRKKFKKGREKIGLDRNIDEVNKGNDSRMLKKPLIFDNKFEGNSIISLHLRNKKNREEEKERIMVMENQQNDVSEIAPVVKVLNNTISKTHPVVEKHQHNFSENQQAAEVQNNLINKIHQVVEKHQHNVSENHPVAEVEKKLINKIHPVAEVQNNLINNIHPVAEVQNNIINKTDQVVEVQNNFINKAHPEVEVQNNLINETHPVQNNFINKTHNNTIVDTVKTNLNDFVQTSINSIKIATDSFALQLFDIYSKLAHPNYEKVKKGDYYSELLYIKVLPFSRITLFLFSILFALVLVGFILFSITNYLSKFIFKTKPSSLTKSESEERDNNSIRQKINLKGRHKRNPNNINYNELFIDNSSKIRTKKETKNKRKETPIDEKKSENLDDFFERVKEKNDFEQLFRNNDIPTNFNNNLNAIPHPQTILKQENTVTIMFEEKDKKFQLDVLMNNPIIKTEVTVPVVDNTPILIKTREEKKEDKFSENDQSLSIEEKMKNPSLFSQTPLVNARKNTIPKNNIKK